MWKTWLKWSVMGLAEDLLEAQQFSGLLDVWKDSHPIFHPLNGSNRLKVFSTACGHEMAPTGN
jgi:hypothetical protein